jgi:hypothetical protein
MFFGRLKVSQCLFFFVRSVGPLKTSRVQGYRGNTGNYHGKEDWDRIAHWKISDSLGRFRCHGNTCFFGFNFGTEASTRLTPMIGQHHELPRQQTRNAN